jgi:hypothetical protein
MIRLIDALLNFINTYNEEHTKNNLRFLARCVLRRQTRNNYEDELLIICHDEHEIKNVSIGQRMIIHLSTVYLPDVRSEVCFTFLPTPAPLFPNIILM